MQLLHWNLLISFFFFSSRLITYHPLLYHIILWHIISYHVIWWQDMIWNDNICHNMMWYNRRWYVMRRDEKKKMKKWKTTNFNEEAASKKINYFQSEKNVTSIFFKILFCWKHLIGKENRPSKLLVLSVKLYITDIHIWSSHCKEYFFNLHLAHFFILILLCFW